MSLQQRLRVILFVLAVFVIAPSTLIAQQTTTTCESVVQVALSQVGVNCASLEPNQICYGYNNIVTTSVEGATTPVFNQPAQLAKLTSMASVQTSPLNVTDKTWGIAMMSIQANLPVALPGRGVIVIPIGDVRLENAVNPADALTLPDQALPVTTTGQTDLFDTFSREGQAVGAVPANTTLQVDGVSPDGQWLRAYYEHENDYNVRAAAWVNVKNIKPTNMDTLPVITPDSMTPMQSFYLQMGSPASVCPQSPPSMVYVQGPSNIETDITVNGANIRISSTVILQILPGNLLKLTVLSGIVTLDPDSPNPILVPAGYTSQICLSNEPVNVGDDGVQNDLVIGSECAWSTPVQVSLEDLEILRPLEGIPGNLVNYTLTLPGLVCPSGVGNPVCEIVVNDQSQLQILRSLCSKNILPASICSTIRGL